MTTTAQSTLMSRLKAQTAEQHSRAEGRALQRSLATGAASRDLYADWLSQMFLVHQAIERALAVAPSSALIDLARRSPSHAAHVQSDLAALGRSQSPAPIPTSSVDRLISDFQSPTLDPAQLFGMFYVLEGSMNGNRYIAMAIRKGLGLPPGTADAYLDPYGPRQREVWAEFRTQADAAPVSEPEVEAAVRGARRMFDAIAALSDELVS